LLLASWILLNLSDLDFHSTKKFRIQIQPLPTSSAFDICWLPPYDSDSQVTRENSRGEKTKMRKLAAIFAIVCMLAMIAAVTAQAVAQDEAK